MTQELAKANKSVHFSCMHPGWADTPGKYIKCILINTCVLEKVNQILLEAFENCFKVWQNLFTCVYDVFIISSNVLNIGNS